MKCLHTILLGAPLALGLGLLSPRMARAQAGGEVTLSIVSVNPARPHLVPSGRATTFVLSLASTSSSTRTVHVQIAAPTDWLGALATCDSLFQPSGPASPELDVELAAGSTVHLITRLVAPSGASNGMSGEAVVSASVGEVPQGSVTLNVRVRNEPKLYYVAIDGLGRGYLEINRQGGWFDGTGERLMPRVKAFQAEGAYFSDATSLLPASTDVDHTAALSGSWPGTLGIPSIRRYYSGEKRNGKPDFLSADKDLLRFGPDGAPIRTVFDLVKDPASGGDPQAFSAFVAGKEWVGDLYRDDAQTVDIIAGGRNHPDYVPPPQKFRMGDPESDPDAGRDREGTNYSDKLYLLKRFSPKARNVGNLPDGFPEDRWIAEAAVRIISAEDPDVLYVLLAECDTSQHTFGTADHPEDWTDPGTPNILWDDINRFNKSANRDPVLDIVYEADQCFGIVLDAIDERGGRDGSVVALLADHGQITAMEQRLPLVDILRQLGVASGEIEFLFSRHSVSFLFLTDPSRSSEIASLLESYEVFHPVLKRMVRPFIVFERDEMESGIDNVEGHVLEDGIVGNHRGEIYSEWDAEYPVADDSKVKWPDIMIFNDFNFQTVLTTSQDLKDGATGPATIGTHAAPASTSIPLILRGPRLVPGVYGRKCTLADIAPTIYPLLGLVVPANVDGRVLDEALAQ